MRRALSILAPLGWLYGSGAALRRKAYAFGVLRSQRLRSPVVSVGGLAMGGSMKTPAVIELARAIALRGPAVGVIGHGYRGTALGPRVVSDGESPLETAETAGDEALLLAHELPGCPLVIGPDKAAAGRLLEDRFGKRIVLIDSGFQHLRLFRDLDIVCVTEDDLGARVMPAGMLREPPRALRFANLILVDRETEGPRVHALRVQRPKDVFSMGRAEFGFFSFEGTGVEAEKPEKAFAFCGIGNPERFVRDLAAQGVAVTGRRFFRDHHAFSEEDLRDVTAAAAAAGATALVTTTKDAMRIGEWKASVPLLVMSARLQIERMNEVLKRIDSMILARMKAGL